MTQPTPPTPQSQYRQSSQQQQWGAPPQVHYVVAQPSPGTNGLAIASMVLGILWLYWLGSILAVIFGHIALSQIKRTNQGGKGMAVAGLVLGYIGIAVLAVVIIALVAASSSSGY
jgi:hypothetical protein